MPQASGGAMPNSVNVFEEDYAVLPGLWKYHYSSDARTKYFPLFYSNLRGGIPLVVGLNPSFIDEMMRNLSSKLFNRENFYSYNGSWISRQDALRSADEHLSVIERYKKYFGIYNTIFGGECEFIDLFRFRQTKDVKTALKLPNDDFANSQIELCKKVVTLLNPSIILVANAYASEKFIENGFVGSKTIDDDGIYRSKKTDAPIFLSGMLTGQRPETKPARQRLLWHMKYIIDKYHIKNYDNKAPVVNL